MEEVETRGLRPFPGAKALLDALPRTRWAVVTSGSPAVARLRMDAGGVPQPPILVTAADVRRGKPAPDPYLQAATVLGWPPAACLVIEDAVAGVVAGRAAGMVVAAVAGTAPRDALSAAHYFLQTLGHLRLVSSSADGLVLDLVSDR